MRQYRIEFLFTLILLFTTIILSIIGFVFWYNLIFFIGSYFFIHWLGLFAAIFIVISIPLYYLIKWVKPQNFKLFMKIHVLGNLFAFMIVSIHFAQNFGRLAGALYRLNDGFLLYLLLILIVGTGINDRYKISQKLLRYTKFIHKYSVIILFLIMTIHILEGFNIQIF